MQQEEIVLSRQWNIQVMSNAQLKHFVSEVDALCDDDKLQVVAIILDSLRSSPKKALDDNAVMQLFEKFNGCIKSSAKLDCREEMNAYLDERYGDKKN